jgi:UTP:GlnB (protein PII) uridylyltransferase
LQVLVYTPDQTDLFARICGYFDQAGFSILDARIHTANNGFALDTFQVVSPHLGDHPRELTALVEAELARTLEKAGALPPPGKGRVSRRVKSFPVAPRVDLRPDEKAQRWLLSISASDRVGLLYSVARVLAGSLSPSCRKTSRVTQGGGRKARASSMSGRPRRRARPRPSIRPPMLFRATPAQKAARGSSARTDRTRSTSAG